MYPCECVSHYVNIYILTQCEHKLTSIHISIYLLTRYIYIYIYIVIYLPPPPKEQDATQGQFLSGVFLLLEQLLYQG